MWPNSAQSRPNSTEAGLGLTKFDQFWAEFVRSGTSLGQIRPILGPEMAEVGPTEVDLYWRDFGQIWPPGAAERYFVPWSAC